MGQFVRAAAPDGRSHSRRMVEMGKGKDEATNMGTRVLRLQVWQRSSIPLPRYSLHANLERREEGGEKREEREWGEELASLPGLMRLHARRETKHGPTARGHRCRV